MDATVMAKSSRINRLEGTVLTATLLALPMMTFGALLGRLYDAANGSRSLWLYALGASHFGLGSSPGELIRTLVLGSLLYGLMMPTLARNFPTLIQAPMYEPLFFDASLSLSDKVTRWRMQPATSVQLLTWMLMLSVMAIAVLCVG